MTTSRSALTRVGSKPRVRTTPAPSATFAPGRLCVALRRLLALRPLYALTAGMLAGACSLLPVSPTIALYQPTPFVSAPAVAGASATPATASPTATGTVAWRLSVNRPHSQGQLNNPRILVMPRPGELEVYPQAQWAEAPPLLMADLILDSLVRSNRILSVDRRTSGLDVDYELTSDLRAFQIEIRNGTAYAVVRLQARLIAHPQNRVVDSQLFEAEAPAASQQVGVTVKAFDQALGMLLPQLTTWTLDRAERHWATRGKP